MTRTRPISMPILISGLTGCALIVAGTLMPWMTLFAGLKSMNGLTGMNGRLLIGAAVFSAVVLVAASKRASMIYALAGVIAGASILGFSLWLLQGLREVVGRTGKDAMLIGHAGPGLFIVAVGGAITLAAALSTLTPMAARR